MNKYHGMVTTSLLMLIVKDILTKSASHPHGIKVSLESGMVGRVKELIHKSTN